MASKLWLKAGKLLFVGGKFVYDDHCCCGDPTCGAAECSDSYPGHMQVTLGTGFLANCGINVDSTVWLCPLVGGNWSLTDAVTYAPTTVTVQVRIDAGHDACAWGTWLCGVTVVVNFDGPPFFGGPGCHSSVFFAVNHNVPMVCAGLNLSVPFCGDGSVNIICCTLPGDPSYVSYTASTVVAA